MPARRKPTKKHRNTRVSARSAKKEAPVEHELPGGFWRQIVAILMVALALFFVITWFGHGGSVVNSIHETILKGLGIATYTIPALLVYLAVKIFRSENNRVAIPVYIASILMVLWVSGIGAIWNHGGLIGGWLNTIMTKALDQSFVIVIYIILIFITAAFILQLSPLTFFKGTKNLVKKSNKIEQKEETGKNLGQLEIKVNSSIAPKEEPVKKQKGLFIHKAKEEPKASEPVKAEPKAEEKALVELNDPDWKMPSTDLLEKKQSPADAGNIQQNAYGIKSTLAEFGIEVEMEGANVGPRVTQYTMRPPAGVNLSKILARDKELALNLAVDKIRIEAQSQVRVLSVSRFQTLALPTFVSAAFSSLTTGKRLPTRSPLPLVKIFPATPSLRTSPKCHTFSSLVLLVLVSPS